MRKWGRFKHGKSEKFLSHNTKWKENFHNDMSNIIYVSTKQSNSPFKIFIAIESTQKLFMLVTSDITHMRLGWRVDGEGASYGAFHIILYYVICSIYHLIMSNTTYITCITYILLIYITYIISNSQPFSPFSSGPHHLTAFIASLLHTDSSSLLQLPGRLSDPWECHSPFHLWAFTFPALSVRFFPPLFA